MDQQDENAVSFLDHVAERHQILTKLQAAEYKDWSTDSPPRRLPPHVSTLDVWVALHVSPYGRLNRLDKMIDPARRDSS
ncbi:hypothetical protein CkaCkLH20_03155 [Colletotrichum karsti]|uniref:Uncharacterized protein n=1 Tax=Colletotrichum karsti TaxID=1095194 RepID=A0A9P6IA11_9PEZI|nr:uncharacterized protein CkaCkLH20_03155 [Colletotrichum karsti]KAF9879612.1 hypothetical protein CkaCkLH20_03155 [Colletotrichum karsti]